MQIFYMITAELQSIYLLLPTESKWVRTNDFTDIPFLAQTF
jgi:hypothetical protein